MTEPENTWLSAMPKPEAPGSLQCQGQKHLAPYNASARKLLALYNAKARSPWPLQCQGQKHLASYKAKAKLMALYQAKARPIWLYTTPRPAMLTAKGRGETGPISPLCPCLQTPCTVSSKVKLALSS